MLLQISVCAVTEEGCCGSSNDHLSEPTKAMASKVTKEEQVRTFLKVSS